MFLLNRFWQVLFELQVDRNIASFNSLIQQMVSIVHAALGGRMVTAAIRGAVDHQAFGSFRNPKKPQMEQICR